MTERLWAPWRMAYITAGKHEGCIFCDKPKEDRDAENLILYRSDAAFVMINAYPYNNGHLMVVPYTHCSDLLDLKEAELAEMMLLSRLCTRVLDQACHPEGYNLGINLGRVAGAGIADHVHIHIVPRWQGDTNFMTAVADTKVLPQSLKDTYHMLHPFFKAEAKGP
jgi:ATP adenylyltransferase